MENFNIKFVSKKDIISFNDWCIKEGIFFLNGTFMSEFLSINSEEHIEKSHIEFYIYNKLVLHNTYDFKPPTWMNEIDSSYNVKDIVKNVFKDKYRDRFKYFEELLTFGWEYDVYKSQKGKDNNREYQLLEIYWKFLKAISESGIDHFNLWVLFINKNIYETQKGFKK